MATSAVQVDEQHPPVLIDEPPTVHRSRRPMDAARLALTLTGVVLVVVLSLTASRTVAGIEGDLNEASALVPGWVLLPLTFVAAFATLALWIGFVGLEIAQRQGRTAAEMMVFARYVMFSEVYWHHAVRSATGMFARAFYELHDQIDIQKLFGSTDAEMISVLRSTAASTEVEPLLESLFGFQRNLYKLAAEFSHDQESKVYTLIAGRPYDQVATISNQLVEVINRKHQLSMTSLELLIDAPPPHREVEFAIDVYFAKKNEYRPLRQVSPVIDALATTQFDDWVKRVRVFVAPKWRDLLESVNLEELLLETIESPEIKE